MSKKMCKTDKKDQKKQGKVKFECKSCGSVAAKEKLLCKPKKV